MLDTFWFLLFILLAPIFAIGGAKAGWACITHRPPHNPLAGATVIALGVVIALAGFVLCAAYGALALQMVGWAL